MRDLSPPLGRVIRRHRLAARLSQEELAERAGLHRVYVSLVERGRRNITVNALTAIGEGVGVRASRLLAEAEEAGAPDPGKPAAP